MRRTTGCLVNRLPGCDDDRGSLAMAVMAVLVGATLGALILPIVISQNKATQFDISRVRSLHAAQTGLDVALGQIRASQTTVDGIAFGDPTKLPCYGYAAGSELTGTANGTNNGAAGSGSGSYRVTVTYWAVAPGTPDASKMRCSPSPYGTYDPATKTASPRFAVIRSTGTDVTGAGRSNGRTISSTYVFQTDDTNIPGGLIKLYDSPAAKMCMDAGRSPTVNSPVVLGVCSVSTPPLAQQMFAYRRDLSIQLVSSVDVANPFGLCLDTDSPAHYGNPSVVLKKCVIPNPAACAEITNCSPASQQWSINASAHLEGASSNQPNPSTLDGKCIHAIDQTSGQRLRLANCEDGLTNPRQTWVPSATAGAGMADARNKMLVNYKQFATCLDVPGNGDASSTYLQLYSCKQNPDPDLVGENQKFVPSPSLTPRPIKVQLKTILRQGGSPPYCLTSKLLAVASPNNTAYVTVTPCRVGAPMGNQAWTVYQTQDEQLDALPYAKKFTIVDEKGFCLGPGRPDDLRNDAYLKVTVQTCDGSTGQKWNADASLDLSRITNTRETTP